MNFDDLVSCWVDSHFGDGASCEVELVVREEIWLTDDVISGDWGKLGATLKPRADNRERLDCLNSSACKGRVPKTSNTAIKIDREVFTR